MKIIKLLIATVFFQQTLIAQVNYPSPVRSDNERVAPGKFEPTWESLKQYETPEWLAPDEFYITGTGIVITFAPTVQNKNAGFINIDEGRFENEKWIPGRRMNGDQDHQGRHLRIPGNEYSIQHVKLYTY